MKTISLKLPEALDAKLTAFAPNRGERKSDVVRQALEAHLAHASGTPKGSCLDLARDLVGSVKGPADFSFNKEHLKDLGK